MTLSLASFGTQLEGVSNSPRISQGDQNDRSNLPLKTGLYWALEI